MLIRSSSVVAISFAMVLSAQDAPRPPHSMPPAAPGHAAPMRTAQQEVEALVVAARRCDAVAFWEWLPSGYRGDIEDLVHSLADRVDAKVYDRAWQLVRRIAQVGIDKQEFVFGNALVAANTNADPQEAAAIRAAYAAVFALLRELAGSDLATIEGLRAFDGRAFCGKSGKPMLEALLKIAQVKGNDTKAALENMVVRTVRQTDGEASIELSAPGRPAAVQRFVRMDGRWVPAEMARKWTSGLDDLRTQIAAMPAKPDPAATARFRLVLGTVEGFLKKFEEAETQAEFDEACQAVMRMGGLGTAAPGR